MPPADGRRRALAGLLAVTLLALLVRLVALGGRAFHWDEGRVGYWILRYEATGQFHYRPIIHGPFIQHANELLFSAAEPTDFLARLPVALVGGTLPLSAWLLRDHLDDVEVVALGTVLAVDPLLVYYSRFMRSDVLVGAFAVWTFAFAVRAWTTREVRYAYPVAIAFALAAASKENVVLYALCFVGAGVLVYDHRLVRAVRAGRSATTTLRADLGGAAATARERSGGRDAFWWTAGHAAGVALAFLTVAVLLYAPRPDLWVALGNPTALPGVVEEATLGSWDRFSSLWGTGRHQDHAYLPFAIDLWTVLLHTSPVVLALGAVGIVADGYAGRNRAVVAFATYWAVASLLGYPAATDIKAPWAGVHVLFPLAIPAAVGAGVFVRALASGLEVDRGAAAGRLVPDGGVAVDVDRERLISTTLAALVLAGALVGVAAPNADYWNADSQEDDVMIQWAQPENELAATLGEVDRVAAANDGVDVLFYGTSNPRNGQTRLFVENESSADQPPPGGPAWHSRLPLQWYLEGMDARVDSTEPGTDPATIAERDVPVVIAYSWDREELAAELDGYEAHTHRFKLWGEEIVIFIDQDAPRAGN